VYLVAGMTGRVLWVTHGEFVDAKEPLRESREARAAGRRAVGATHSSAGVRGNSDHSVSNRSVRGSALTVKES